MNTFLEVPFLVLVFETFSFGELLSELLEDRLTLRVVLLKRRVHVHSNMHSNLTR